MSIATRASVWWITIEPPDGRGTRLFSAFSISASTPNASKRGSGSR
jgi:hypothetical protein